MSINEQDEAQLNEMIEDMFEEYMSDGFDFNTEQSFGEVFKDIFSDAVRMTIEVLEASDEEDEDENPEPPLAA